jgi:hypothetical protein
LVYPILTEFCANEIQVLRISTRNDDIMDLIFIK